jgi:hypothetical protein
MIDIVLADEFKLSIFVALVESKASLLGSALPRPLSFEFLNSRMTHTFGLDSVPRLSFCLRKAGS